MPCRRSSPNPARSVSVGDTADVPLGIRVFGIGCHLAELIVGLRAGADRESVPQETQSYIDQVNRDFGNLREVLQMFHCKSLAETSVVRAARIDPSGSSRAQIGSRHPDGTRDGKFEKGLIRLNHVDLVDDHP